MKSRSTLDNAASLCGYHHNVKTLQGRTWRPVLIELIGRLTPQHAHVELIHGCPDCDSIREGMSA